MFGCGAYDAISFSNVSKAAPLSVCFFDCRFGGIYTYKSQTKNIPTRAYIRAYMTVNLIHLRKLFGKQDRHNSARIALKDNDLIASYFGMSIRAKAETDSKNKHVHLSPAIQQFPPTFLPYATTDTNSTDAKIQQETIDAEK